MPSIPRPILLPLTGALLMLAATLLWRLGASLDRRMLTALTLDPRDALMPLTLALTTLGGFSVLGPAALAAAGWLCWRRRTGDALWLFLAIGSGRLMVEGIKVILQRPRPPVGGRLAEVSSYSFPSSHSAGTMLTFLALAMLLPVNGRRLFAPAIAFAMLIGWSRIALGVHWPSDVLAGWGFGLLWAGAARYWLPARRPSVPTWG